MSSHQRRDNNHSMFTSKTPHFFKVILQDTIRDGILVIPRRFVRKYGNQLPSTVKLEVPSGAIWQVELTKSDGRVRLQEGWREFAEHYSLELGSFVVFRYDGNDHFGVLIFDRSASEIEYAHTRTGDDNVSAGRKRKMIPDLPCPLPQKKTRTGSKLEDLSSHISLDDPKSENIKLRNLKKNENSCSSKGQVDGVGVNSARGSVEMEVLCCWQKLTDAERAHAIQIANAFKRTENPVFLVFLRPSSLRYPYQMHIPLDFARKFLAENSGNLTISNSAGKTWPLKYFRSAGNKTLHAQLYGGWRAFVEDNHLGVGDMCAFELIKHPEILMKVNVYPLVSNAREACRPRSDKSIANRVRTRSLVNDTEPDCRQTPCPSSSKEFKVPKLNKQRKSVSFQYSAKELGGEFKFSAKHNNGGVSGAWGYPKPDLFGKIKPLTTTEKQRAFIQASAFKSANRYFTVVMQPSYVITDCYLNIPYKFAKRCFKKSGEITLRVSDGRTWVMNYKRKVTSAKFLRNNWRAFVLDNNLKVGDICVFELIKENEKLLEVSIFSAAHAASWSSSRLVSRKSKEKSHLPCPLPWKKMRTDSPNKLGTNSKLEILSSGISSDQSNSSKINLGDLRKVENSTGQLNAEKSLKTEAISCLQHLTATEKARAVQIACAFKSTGNPVFMVVMRPSFIHNGRRMCIPTAFARKFLTMQKCNLILCNSAGKTWSVKYRKNVGIKFLQAELCGGWQAFVEDNHLRVGDICIFELIKCPEIFMKVSIYPVVENVSKACRPLAHRSISNQVTRRVVSDTEPISAAYIARSRKSEEKSHLPCSLPRKKMRTDSPNQAGHLNPEGSLKTEALTCSQHLTTTAKAHAVQIASAFKSTGNPLFTVVMQPSFVCNKYVLGIPSDFAREFLTMQKCNVTLCNSAGKTWPAMYRRNAESKNLQPVLYGGWQAFVEDNHLGVGDICVFELIKHPEILMKVVIYLVVENASKACRSLAHGSIANRVKTRSLVSDTEPTCQQSPCPSSSRKFKDPTDAYIEILDDSTLNQKTNKKLTSNMMRTNSNGSIRAKGIKLKKEKKSTNSQCIKKELWGDLCVCNIFEFDESKCYASKAIISTVSILTGELKYSAKYGSGRMSGGRRSLKPDLMGGIKAKPSTPTEKQGAGIGASDFRTSNPSFSVVMHPAYVTSCTHLRIPGGFAERYLENNGEIVLRVPDGRTWTVEYEIMIENEHRRARFHSRSWRPFVKGNELKVGDVCIFELTKNNGNLLEVVIRRKIDIS
ncbi:hypothetical protein V6N11_041010 [Hibiscus sabdariffa]|uniref:TF-B3 domain-containing protein n=1 Tax=Hibiscus sabdariffa TaxID=183260 RepID=A0ABR2RJJ0_9ROSI